MVFTGPAMKVVYSGCRYNSIVFTPVAPFEQWLHEIDAELRKAVMTDHGKYKVSPRGTPTFSQFIVQQSRDPDIYPDEIRCRLATTRTGTDINDQVITASFVDESGQPVSPQDIWGGGFVVPIFKLAYYKQGDDFGLQLTLLKGLYQAPMEAHMRNSDWEFDLPRQ